MKITKGQKMILFFACLMLVFVGGAFYMKTHREQTQEYFGRLVGAMPGNSRANANWNKGVKTLSFEMEMPYPGSSTLSYYADRYRTKGWVPMDEPKGAKLRQWISTARVDPKTKTETALYQYQEAWVNGTRTKAAILTLAYAGPKGTAWPPKPDNKKLFVGLQEGPFIQPKMEEGSDLGAK